MGKWFDRLIGASKTPITVTWSPTMPSQANEDGSFIVKHLTWDKITLTIGMHASFKDEFKDEFEVNIMVLNASKKALGFGAEGVVLVVTSGGRTAAYKSKCLKVGYPNIFDSPDLRDSDKPRKIFTVDTMANEDHLRAVFDAIPEGEQVEVLIQANRIFAAPYLFRIPFDFQCSDLGAAS